MSLRNPRPCSPLSTDDYFAAQARADEARAALLREVKGTIYHASATLRWREALAVRDYIESVICDAGEYDDRERRGTLCQDCTEGKANDHEAA